MDRRAQFGAGPDRPLEVAHPGPGRPVRAKGLRALRLVPCAALLACAAPARYVVVSEPLPARPQVDPWQRLVCLAREDAAAVAAPILDLRTRADVERYGRARRGDRGPLEDVLYAVIAGDYGHAEAALRERPSAFPEYLRRLLVADLASERPRSEVPTEALLGLYQDAFDAQRSEEGRTIIELRVRQLRYGR